jgi:hypothetical protein
MNRQTVYPLSLSTGQVPPVLNGMRVEFSERVALYPVDLEQVAAPIDQDGR